jgi:hypothetical protein
MDDNMVRQVGNVGSDRSGTLVSHSCSGGAFIASSQIATSMCECKSDEADAMTPLTNGCVCGVARI